MQDSNHSQPLEGLPPTELPEDGARYTFIAGLAGGLALALINIAIIMANSTAFRQVSQAAGTTANVSNAVASFVGALQCVVLLIGAIICFFTGFLVGKKVIQRRSGFYAASLVGLLLFLSNTILNFFPASPTHTIVSAPTSGPGVAIGVMFLIILAVIFGCVAGLIGLLGARIATNKHPYYHPEG